MRRLGAAVIGGILALSAFVGATDAGEPTLTSFYLALAGTSLGVLTVWITRGRRGKTWRWSHTVGASIAGALLVSVVTVAVLNPGNAGGRGFAIAGAIGGGLGWGLILGFCAALLVYAVGLSKSAKSTPTETSRE